MGLEQVLSDVQRDGEKRAQAVLDAARAEAKAILADAQAKVAAYEQAGRAKLERDSAQLRTQVASSSESEARKAILTKEAALRTELHRRLIDGFGKQPEAARRKHIEALAKRAAAVVPSGRVWGNAADRTILSSLTQYKWGGEAPISGGLIVESDDGRLRLDLSYETILDEAWRDILRAESKLFA